MAVETEGCFFDTAGLPAWVSLEGEGAAESETTLFEARPPSEERNGTMLPNSAKFANSGFEDFAEINLQIQCLNHTHTPHR